MKARKLFAISTNVSAMSLISETLSFGRSLMKRQSYICGSSRILSLSLGSLYIMYVEKCTNWLRRLDFSLALFFRSLHSSNVSGLSISANESASSVARNFASKVCIE